MADQLRPNRRDFLASLGAGSIGALSLGLTPTSVAGQQTASVALRGQDAEYLFEPGFIYLQTGSMGPCSHQVIEASCQAWREMEANPAPMSYADGATLVAAESSRTTAAEFLGCEVEEVVVTRSTTDGMNAIAQGLDLGRGDRVLTSDQEHEGGLSGWEYLVEREGIHLDVVPIPSGAQDPQDIVDRFADALTPDTRVIFVSHVLSSTGLVMPVEELSALAHSRDMLCVVDGAQGPGNVRVDLQALGCDAYATSGHKWLLAPKGTGLLYIRREAASAVRPIQLKDGRAFYSHSSGVGNLPGVVGLGVALGSLRSMGMETVERHNRALRDRFYRGLREISAVDVVSPPPGPMTSGMISFSLPSARDSVEFRDLLRSHRIEAKVVPKRWLNGIRFSTHVFNSESQVDTVLEVLTTELT